jgi:hypothetical protein
VLTLGVVAELAELLLVLVTLVLVENPIPEFDTNIKLSSKRPINMLLIFFVGQDTNY